MSYRSIALAAVSTLLGVSLVEASVAWSGLMLTPAREDIARAEPPAGFQKAKVHRVLGTNEGPVVLLRPEGLSAYLPIWVGTAEARAIGRALYGIDVTRPMSHDFLSTAIAELGAEVAHVRVDRIRTDLVYIASVVLVRGRETMTLDARPSDAMALALRTGAPIYVSEGLEPHMLSTASLD